MSTGEGAADGGNARDDHDEHGHRGERIAISGSDDSVTRIQLAARWAEAYGRGSDSLGGILKRFRAAYEYLDAVTHGVEPPELERELLDTRAVVAPAGAPAVQNQSPPQYGSQPQPPPAAQSEPRPWG